MEFDKEIILEINKLIACKNTDAITFVLSDKNQIILNAIGNNKVVNNWGLKRFDKQVKKQKELSYMLWKGYDQKTSILSRYLNAKIQKFESKIKTL